MNCIVCLSFEQSSVLACVQTSLPSGEVGEGAFLRFFLKGGRGEGSVHRLVGSCLFGSSFSVNAG